MSIHQQSWDSEPSIFSADALIRTTWRKRTIEIRKNVLPDLTRQFTPFLIVSTDGLCHDVVGDDNRVVGSTKCKICFIQITCVSQNLGAQRKQHKKAAQESSTR
jgi:hypothetical protein